MPRAVETRFFGSFENKIDAKGRLATPALFRRAMQLDPENNIIYCIPSTEQPCIECGGIDFVDNRLAMVEQLEPFSKQREDLEFAFATQMRPLTADKEGRINLPDDLRDHANLNGTALFAGAIRSFQIWSPDAYRARLELAKKGAGEARLSLRNPPPPEGRQ